ncbi:MAG: hypothetical protein A3C93_06385 [Candidatus Lloydbacteria bacterium RIFCSPHIGHO2_02_FULL_54_17]|uniref:UDP-N-acetylmuramoyl-tripeptide--D-alanyl-D-alanine ligase n=1 Tax=Candidatus Lloydbacteria bacterium RIFCSPHIGHO2_02_FULL_54_17 TaxID=1798664 RepID=A0A1G2DGB0_9BACT|nr:MAG: hypothetical protein A3C93_06385 [Candidatus Lloydbacteria bacterium RIFCSPHIGHO2_02_FULL_54_17]OGZ13555.1 MAG: hypothetical protein A2948_05045 [Candidatus Lloydbacteria bacterium RIFCSPLOWO2_01_FULL_54_18]OGZ16223.1 MAG: hypothetical protein A3H76_03875 [Candidatus Lloydbacteria bacterium RIFCSPLOWO2_02_FULL_54_12]
MRQFFKHIVVYLLTLEARCMLRKHKPFVIAVTGSVGKTTAKDAIFHVLKDTASVRKSEKSFNSEIGIPLTILGLPNAWHSLFGWAANLFVGFWRLIAMRDYPKTLVLEVGADHPGDITRLMRWLHPDVAVITRLPETPVHVEFFASPEEVRKEKAELLRGLKKDGIFIGCADDTSVVELTAETKARTLLFGLHSEAAVRAEKVLTVYDGPAEGKVPTGTSFSVFYSGETKPVFLRGVLGTPSVMAALAALAVGIARGESLERMAKTLETFATPPGRMRIIPGKNGATIIDDSYNSSPIAAEEALKTLRTVEGKRRVALMGDMLELGAFAEEEHKKVGAAAAFVDVLVTVGKRARWIAEGARKAGFAEGKVKSFDDSALAGEWVAKEMHRGDSILVKGSQGSGENLIRTERAVKILMAHPEDAPKLLVRQESEWLAQYQ